MWPSRHIDIHKDKMADAAAHDKQMENFMGAEILMSGVEDGKLQRIDHTPRGIDEAAGQQPEKSSCRQGAQQLAEHQDAHPAHGNINHRGKPFGTGDPEGFDQHASDGDAPHQGKQGVARCASQHDQAYRRVGSGNQHKYHHMVNFAEELQARARQVHTVIGGAGAVEQDHAEHEYGHGGQSDTAAGYGCLYQQRHGGKNSHHHADKMGQGAARFSNCNLHSNTSD